MVVSCILVGLLVAGCGSSDKDDMTPEERMDFVRQSEIGLAYDSCPLFEKSQWNVLENPERGTFVHFMGVYNLEPIFKQTCEQYVAQHGPEAAKDLERIARMEHRAAFVVEAGNVLPAFSGWSVTCPDGREMRVEDKELNSVKEVTSGVWTSECQEMLEIARTACPTEAEVRALQEQMDKGAQASGQAGGPEQKGEAGDSGQPGPGTKAPDAKE